EPRGTSRRRGSVRAHRRGSERQRRILSEAHGLIARAQRLAEARQIAPRALEAAQRLMEIERVGRFGERLLDGQAIGRRPILAGHRRISPRCGVRSTVSVNELIDTCRAKKRSSTAPSKNTLAPSNARSSHSNVISRPRANVSGPDRGSRRTTGALATERTPAVSRRAAAEPRSA